MRTFWFVAFLVSVIWFMYAARLKSVESKASVKCEVLKGTAFLKNYSVVCVYNPTYIEL